MKVANHAYERYSPLFAPLQRKEKWFFVIIYYSAS